MPYTTLYNTWYTTLFQQLHFLPNLPWNHYLVIFTPVLNAWIQSGKSYNLKDVPDCEIHDDVYKTCGCQVFTSPSLTHSKIGAVLHLEWRTGGNISTIDVDINCPILTTSTEYDGGIEEVRKYLDTEKPVKWLEEYRKLIFTPAAMLSESSVRMRLVNRSEILPREVKYNTVIYNFNLHLVTECSFHE